jgi:hypothetical protein
MTAVLHKYIDGGRACFANLTLVSGERVMLSLARGSFALLRLHLGGYLPGRRLFVANAFEVIRMQRVLQRHASTLPALPRATMVHRDDAQMEAFLDAALVDLKAVTDGRPAPGAVGSLDLDAMPDRPLALLTRLALTGRDAADCVRLYERAKNTAG